VGALVRGEDLSAVPAVRDWLEHTSPRPYHLNGSGGPDSAGPDIAEAVQAHVLGQLDRLRAYPRIAKRLEDGRLRLHGWFYEIHTGSVLAHQPRADAFLPL
jgi:carbonic anhydrase